MFCGKLRVALGLLAVTLLYELYKPMEEESFVRAVSQSWDAIERPPKRLAKVLVGVNANLDMIVSAKDLLLALQATPSNPRNHQTLYTVKDLEQLVSYSMLHCAGIERSFVNPDIFQDIVERATSIRHKYHIGGNAALMAEKIKTMEPSAQVVLVGPIGPKIKDILNVAIVTPSYNASTRDEVHMILEYSASEQWAEVSSTCANRVIFSHDELNAKMMSLDDVEDIVNKVQPDLVVLSGAHLLESQMKEFWSERLKESSAILNAVTVPVHWELATVGSLEFFKDLSHALLPNIESLGLNEQEMVSLAASCGAPFDFVNMPPKPSVAVVSDLLHWLMTTFSSSYRSGSVLSRVHLHSLSFHIIAVINDGPWHNSRQSVMAGAREVGLQACDSTKFTSTMFKTLLPREFHISLDDPELSQVVMSATTGIAEWSRGEVLYYLSPVLVCRNPSKTVGLGDAISASGLLHTQHF